MKLMAGRRYKHDLSDIIGILMMHEESKNPIELHQIKEAVIELYGAWERLPKVSIEFITDAISNKNYKEVYNHIQSEELSNKILLKDFDRDYPGVTKESNVEEILKILNQKLEKENIKSADEK